VNLKRVGAKGRFLGLCAFHHERTPSFSVNRTTQRFKCFGCDATGDAIDFLARFEGLSFFQALKSLAERAGILPDSRWTWEARPRNSQSAARAATLAQELADFANGLRITTNAQLVALSDAILKIGVDLTPVFSDIHRGAWVLHQVHPRDIAATWQAARFDHPEAVRRLVALGREHREQAERVALAIVEVLSLTEKAVTA